LLDAWDDMSGTVGKIMTFINKAIVDQPPLQKLEPLVLPAKVLKIMGEAKRSTTPGAKERLPSEFARAESSESKIRSPANIVTLFKEEQGTLFLKRSLLPSAS